MCGICGQYNFGEPIAGIAPGDRGDDAKPSFIGARMTKAIISMALWDWVFGRLSIIDLGGGHQPMSDQEESVWVVFNGEIYNFQELRASWKGTATSFGPNRTQK